MFESIELEGDCKLVEVKALSSVDKLGINIFWFSESSLLDDMQYELDESVLFSIDLLSISFKDEILLGLCPLILRSISCDVLPIFCWWNWDWTCCFFLLSKWMELLLFFIWLIRIEEGVGVLVMLGGGEKYDNKIGKGG